MMFSILQDGDVGRFLREQGGCGCGGVVILSPDYDDFSGL